MSRRFSRRFGSMVWLSSTRECGELREAAMPRPIVSLSGIGTRFGTRLRSALPRQARFAALSSERARNLSDFALCNIAGREIGG